MPSDTKIPVSKAKESEFRKANKGSEERRAFARYFALAPLILPPPKEARSVVLWVTKVSLFLTAISQFETLNVTGKLCYFLSCWSEKCGCKAVISQVPQGPENVEY